MNEIVGWIVGNTQSGPNSFRKKKPHGWQYSDGLVTQSYHEAEVARLRAEVDALRVKANRYDWIRRRAVLDGANGEQLDSEIDAAMEKGNV